LARLNYVNQNPVRHGIVPVAENYKWCSASWFAENAPPAFAKAVKSFKIDHVSVPYRTISDVECADMSALSKRRHVAALQSQKQNGRAHNEPGRCEFVLADF